MSRRPTRSALLAAIGFATIVAIFASFLARGLPVRLAVEPMEPGAATCVEMSSTMVRRTDRFDAVEPAEEPMETARESIERTADVGGPLRCLAEVLRVGEAGPTEWDAQLVSYADESVGADRAELMRRAVDGTLDVAERLAALELLRALRADEAVSLPIAQERELAEIAFGPLAAGTSAWAAAASLAAFAGGEGRAQLFEQLERGGDERHAQAALYGLRECVRPRVLEEIAARLALARDALAQERFAAAAQGVAHGLGVLASEKPPAPDVEAKLTAFARREDASSTVRRRLLLAAASLGQPESENRLLDIACDESASRDLALEAARALSASPRVQAVEALDLRLATTRIDPSVRGQLEAVRDVLHRRVSLLEP